jgi:hypothetical protein
MFEIREAIERVSVKERSNRDRTIFKPYQHKINSKQLND